MSDSDSNELKRLKHGPRLIALGLLALPLLLLAIVVGAKPAWRAWRRDQALTFVRQAQAAQATNDMTGFLGNLRAANNLAPLLPEVLRLNGDHYSRYRHSDGLFHWHQLRQLGAATREDLLKYARLAIHCDRTELAREVLKPLHYGTPNDAEVLLVLSELFEREGDLPKAREAALDAITRNPRDSEAELRVARLELASQRPAQRIAARGRLYALMAATNQVRVDAAFALMLDDRPSPADLGLIAQLMRRNPVPSFGERLALTLVSLRRGEGTPAKAVAGLQGGLERELNLWERMVAAERLGAAGEYAAVLALLPEDLALTDRNLAAFRLGALASLRDTAGMERILKHPRQPLSAASRDTYWATAAALAYLTNETPALWRTALASCGQDTVAVKALAVQAENAGATETAIECWNHLLPNPATAPQAAAQLLRIAQGKNDPRGIYLALRRLASLRPGQLEHELPLAFYQALLELEPDASSRILEYWEPKAKDEAWLAAAKALFLLRARQPDRAAQRFESAGIDWETAPAAWTVVRIAALGESGDHTAARSLARKLRLENLSAQELNLVSPWLPPAAKELP